MGGLKNTRSIFREDAIDFMTNSTEIASVEVIPIQKLVPYKEHPFKLYEGERLTDMVESIKENGILCPVIVRKLKDTYEILAGHNRVNAAKIAGLDTVPCIVKSKLSDEDAYVYVIETNLMQRSFDDLLLSEKAMVIKERYRMIKNQGKRNDIIRELQILNGEAVPETAQPAENNREAIGKQYGLSGSSVARLLRVAELIPEFKDMLDNGNMGLMAGIHLSYISPAQQKLVYTVASNLGVSIPQQKAMKIRYTPEPEQTESKITAILVDKQAESGHYKRVKLSHDTYQRYFQGMADVEIESVIEHALQEFFAKQ